MAAQQLRQQDLPILLAIAHRIGIPGVRVLTGEDLAEYQPKALHEARREGNVFARVRPEQKLQLIESLQRSRPRQRRHSAQKW